MRKNIKTLTLALSVVTLFSFAAIGCGSDDKDSNKSTEKTTAATTESTPVADEKDNDEELISYTLKVYDKDGAETSYDVQTTETTLLASFDDCDVTYDGDQADWGYSLTTLNGLKADYDADGAYWAIYVNGEYGQLSVDAQPIAEDDLIEIKYEVYTAE